MKDEQLIRALVTDLRPARSMPGFTARFSAVLLWCAVVIGAAVAAAADDLRLPPAAPATLALLMLVAAAAGALVSVIPGRSSWRGALWVTAAGAAVWLVTGSVRAWDVSTAEAWGVLPWTKCLLFTTAVALAAAGGLIPVLRRGWAAQPAATLALSLAAGGAAGALATTIECASTAPLHELVGHLLPVVLLGILGAAAAPLAAQYRPFGERL